MIDPPPARRFYEATVRAAGAAGLGDQVAAVLVRFGLPGLMTRLGFLAPGALDQAALRLHQLYDTLLGERAREISAALDASGVAHFFAKGIALLGHPYHPGDRVISDIDVYVPPSGREAALAALATLGYVPVPDGEQAGPDTLRSALALTRAAGAAALERTTVDLHWALDPVERLLPRPNRPIPARVWRAVARVDALAVPAPEHHAALLAHHLVHGDLAHVRSVLDLAFVLASFPDGGGAEYCAAADELGVRDFAMAAARLVARDLDIARPRAMGDGPIRSRFANRLTLDDWLTLVARTHPDDDAQVTVRRIWRRIQVLGHRAAPTLLADVFAPPPAFLVWRWPGHRVGAARRRHYRQLVRKALRF